MDNMQKMDNVETTGLGAPEIKRVEFDKNVLEILKNVSASNKVIADVLCHPLWKMENKEEK